MKCDTIKIVGKDGNPVTINKDDLSNYDGAKLWKEPKKSAPKKAKKASS